MNNNYYNILKYILYCFKIKGKIILHVVDNFKDMCYSIFSKSKDIHEKDFVNRFLHTCLEIAPITNLFELFENRLIQKSFRNGWFFILPKNNIEKLDCTKSETRFLNKKDTLTDLTKFKMINIQLILLCMDK